MQFYVGVTDYDWFQLHATKPHVDEVNFWRPSSEIPFRALRAGEMFLFKLHSPRNYIAGGGFFTRFLRLQVSLAWDAFGEGNGARSLEEVRARISKYRREPINSHDDSQIGCIVLAEPFFFDEGDWIKAPSDFSLNIVSGKGYTTDDEIGRRLWQDVTQRLASLRAPEIDLGPATAAIIEGFRFGEPTLVMPRLGQGAFRVLVMDAYGRRCAMTGERTLPVLQAAHIRPYSEGGQHELTNGLFLRSDLHTLFDKGYISVEPAERRILVSRRIHKEFENGHDYYKLDGRTLAPPADPAWFPSRENLEYHRKAVFH